MADMLRHRGPDSSGIHPAVDDGVVFAHRHLAIIDTSPAGRQPMSWGRWWLTYNGEIYNYRQLRAHLESKGERFTTQTDTEVLLRLWATYGADCLHMLDGMFAFAVYNTETKEMTLVRDRAGEKPLYWTQRDGMFAFASELRPLLGLLGDGWETDRDALALYALYRYVPAPRSIAAGVNKLPPGHVLTLRDGCATVRRWWSWEVEPTHEVSQKGFMEAVDAVESALVDSVRRRLVSDVPLGMFLSGGIDSSLTTAVACRLGHTPKTFSIGFEGKESEHEQARIIAGHLGTEHRDHVFDSADFRVVASGIGGYLDEPNGDRSCVPTYLLSKFARQHVTVALSGDGGDELFGGYTRYAHPCVNAAHYYEDLLPVYRNVDQCPDEIVAASVLFRTHDPLHALRALDFNRYLHGCVLSKMDRMSMQHGLEVRTPYLSPELLDIARKLPAAYLMNGQMGKLVLREIAARYLPRDVALAPKRGFGMPPSVFAQNGQAVREMLEEATPHCERVGFLKPPGNVNAVWAYIVLGQWLRSVE